MAAAHGSLPARISRICPKCAPLLEYKNNIQERLYRLWQVHGERFSGGDCASEGKDAVSIPITNQSNNTYGKKCIT